MASESITTHFECTMCGKCCHDLKLPLSVAEATAWLERGSNIQILCEAVPWPEEPAADNAPAQHKRGRSFAASSGELPLRVVVILVGAFTGACPHLGADLRCGIYETRPRVCRIYPAEINPFVTLAPEQKLCPPEAWTPERPVLAIDQKIVDATTFELIQQSRQTDMADTAAKALLCAYLDIDTAALANEGLAVFSPPARYGARRAVRRMRRRAGRRKRAIVENRVEPRGDRRDPALDRRARRAGRRSIRHAVRISRLLPRIGRVIKG